MTFKKASVFFVAVSFFLCFPRPIFADFRSNVVKIVNLYNATKSQNATTLGNNIHKLRQKSAYQGTLRMINVALPTLTNLKKHPVYRRAYTPWYNAVSTFKTKLTSALARVTTLENKAKADAAKARQKAIDDANAAEAKRKKLLKEAADDRAKHKKSSYSDVFLGTLVHAAKVNTNTSPSVIKGTSGATRAKYEQLYSQLKEVVKKLKKEKWDVGSKANLSVYDPLVVFHKKLFDTFGNTISGSELAQFAGLWNSLKNLTADAIGKSDQWKQKYLSLKEADWYDHKTNQSLVPLTNLLDLVWARLENVFNESGGKVVSDKSKAWPLPISFFDMVLGAEKLIKPFKPYQIRVWPNQAQLKTFQVVWAQLNPQKNDFEKIYKLDLRKGEGEPENHPLKTSVKSVFEKLDIVFAPSYGGSFDGADSVSGGVDKAVNPLAPQQVQSLIKLSNDITAGKYKDASQVAKTWPMISGTLDDAEKTKGVPNDALVHLYKAQKYLQAGGFLSGILSSSTLPVDSLAGFAGLWNTLKNLPSASITSNAVFKNQYAAIKDLSVGPYIIPGDGKNPTAEQVSMKASGYNIALNHAHALSVNMVKARFANVFDNGGANVWPGAVSQLDAYDALWKKLEKIEPYKLRAWHNKEELQGFFNMFAGLDKLKAHFEKIYDADWKSSAKNLHAKFNVTFKPTYGGTYNSTSGAFTPGAATTSASPMSPYQVVKWGDWSQWVTDLQSGNKLDAQIRGKEKSIVDTMAPIATILGDTKNMSRVPSDALSIMAKAVSVLKSNALISGEEQKRAKAAEDARLAAEDKAKHIASKKHSDAFILTLLNAARKNKDVKATVIDKNFNMRTQYDSLHKQLKIVVPDLLAEGWKTKGSENNEKMYDELKDFKDKLDTALGADNIPMSDISAYSNLWTTLKTLTAPAITGTPTWKTKYAELQKVKWDKYRAMPKLKESILNLDLVWTRLANVLDDNGANAWPHPVTTMMTYSVNWNLLKDKDPYVIRAWPDKKQLGSFLALYRQLYALKDSFNRVYYMEKKKGEAEPAKNDLRTNTKALYDKLHIVFAPTYGGTYSAASGAFTRGTAPASKNPISPYQLVTTANWAKGIVDFQKTGQLATKLKGQEKTVIQMWGTIVGTMDDVNMATRTPGDVLEFFAKARNILQTNPIITVEQKRVADEDADKKAHKKSKYDPATLTILVNTANNSAKFTVEQLQKLSGGTRATYDKTHAQLKVVVADLADAGWASGSIANKAVYNPLSKFLNNLNKAFGENTLPMSTIPSYASLWDTLKTLTSTAINNTATWKTKYEELKKVSWAKYDTVPALAEHMKKLDMVWTRLDNVFGIGRATAWPHPVTTMMNYQINWNLLKDKDPYVIRAWPDKKQMGSFLALYNQLHGMKEAFNRIYYIERKKAVAAEPATNDLRTSTEALYKKLHNVFAPTYGGTYNKATGQFTPGSSITSSNPISPYQLVTTANWAKGIVDFQKTGQLATKLKGQEKTVIQMWNTITGTLENPGMMGRTPSDVAVFFAEAKKILDSNEIITTEKNRVSDEKADAAAHKKSKYDQTFIALLREAADGNAKATKEQFLSAKAMRGKYDQFHAQLKTVVPELQGLGWADGSKYNKDNLTAFLRFKTQLDGAFGASSVPMSKLGEYAMMWDQIKDLTGPAIGKSDLWKAWYLNLRDLTMDLYAGDATVKQYVDKITLLKDRLENVFNLENGKAIFDEVKVWPNPASYIWTYDMVHKNLDGKEPYLIRVWPEEKQMTVFLTVHKQLDAAKNAKDKNGATVNLLENIYYPELQKKSIELQKKLHIAFAPTYGGSDDTGEFVAGLSTSNSSPALPQQVLDWVKLCKWAIDLHEAGTLDDQIKSGAKKIVDMWTMLDGVIGNVKQRSRIPSDALVYMYKARDILAGNDLVMQEAKNLGVIETPAPEVPGVPEAPPAPGVPEAPGATGAPDIPTPDVPTPDVPVPDVPTPDVPVPDVPTPDVPVPDVGKLANKPKSLSATLAFFRRFSKGIEERRNKLMEIRELLRRKIRGNR
ncbi:hypothetical protein HOD08_02595 [bacterium]|nr:hypothetical protein [bacterium]